MAKRQCQGINKRGKPCGVPPLKDGDYCSAHAPELPGSVRFGSTQQATAAGALGGRPRKPRPVERMRERIEADIDRILSPYFDAIDHAVLSATYEGEVLASEVPDLGARIAAAEKLLDRVYGKPKQAIEHSGSGDAPVSVEFALSDQAREAIASALRGRPASR